MKEFKIVVQQGKAGTHEIIQFTLGDTELQRLETFLQFSCELAESDIVRTGNWGQLHYRWEQGVTHEEVDLPDGPLLESLLMRLRPFILQSEPTHVPKIANTILGKNIASQRFRRLLAGYRDVFIGRDQRVNMMDILVEQEGESVSLFSNAMLDLWLNAFYYHKNREEQQRLQERIQPLGLRHAVFHWLWFLEEKCTAVLGLANMVDFLLHNNDKSRALKLSPRTWEHMPRPEHFPPPES